MANCWSGGNREFLEFAPADHADLPLLRRFIDDTHDKTKGSFPVGELTE
jgi:hypothetical protein